MGKITVEKAVGMICDNVKHKTEWSKFKYWIVPEIVKPIKFIYISDKFDATCQIIFAFINPPNYPCDTEWFTFRWYINYYNWINLDILCGVKAYTHTMQILIKV